MTFWWIVVCVRPFAHLCDSCFMYVVCIQWSIKRNQQSGKDHVFIAKNPWEAVYSMWLDLNLHLLRLLLNTCLPGVTLASGAFTHWAISQAPCILFKQKQKTLPFSLWYCNVFRNNDSLMWINTSLNVLVVLGTEAIVSYMLGRCSNIELYPSSERILENRNVF